MSRLAVREATASYIQEAKLPYVGIVHEGRPEVVNEKDYEQNRFGEAVPSDNGSSAVLVVGIPSDERQRRALSGPAAVNDSRIYTMALEVYFASTRGDAIAGQRDYDTIIDGLVDLIRANPTLNAPAGVVWAAGEFAFGVKHRQGEPYTGADGTTVFIGGIVEFQAYEWIAGNV